MGLGSRAFASGIMVLAITAGMGAGLSIPAVDLNRTDEWHNKRPRQQKAPKKKRGK